ncbi:MAG: flagellar biosynthesis/type III secretory pathway protein [Desulfobacteraceae bacterium]|nr:flagellar biosynthesis/type III secretory pathway protein [Desulfobacteraceae bacterium]
MMSLSDIEKDEFKPIDIGTLDSFDDELSQKSDEVKPDLERFKMLFDPAELKGEEPISFEQLYTFDKGVKDEPFEPLIKRTAKDLRPRHPGEGDLPETTDLKKIEQEAPPEISMEEQAFEQGHKKGFDQGLIEGEEKGKIQGYDEGFQKGESEGFKKGELEGGVKGEADGFDKGYQEGRKKAEGEIQKETVQILDPLKDALDTADHLLDTLVEKYEVQILSLVSKISQKAVMASVKVDDEIVRNTILDALKSLVAPEEIILNVSAEDYEYIEMVKDEFFEAVESLKHVAVKSDPLITKGGCKIETATASISTDPDSKLDAIYDAVKNAGLS